MIFGDPIIVDAPKGSNYSHRPELHFRPVGASVVSWGGTGQSYPSAFSSCAPIRDPYWYAEGQNTSNTTTWADWKQCRIMRIKTWQTGAITAVGVEVQDNSNTCDIDRTDAQDEAGLRIASGGVYPVVVTETGARVILRPNAGIACLFENHHTNHNPPLGAGTDYNLPIYFSEIAAAALSKHSAGKDSWTASAGAVQLAGRMVPTADAGTGMAWAPSVVITGWDIRNATTIEAVISAIDNEFQLLAATVSGYTYSAGRIGTMLDGLSYLATLSTTASSHDVPVFQFHP